MQQPCSPGLQKKQDHICSKPQCSAVACEQFKCSRCDEVYYCDRKHQFADLKRHRSQCANPVTSLHPLLGLNEANRNPPNEEVRTVDVVFFPSSGLPARIVSAHCYMRDSKRYHGLKEESIDLRAYINASMVTGAAVGFIRRSSQPHSRLYIAYSERALTDGSSSNACVHRYTDGIHKAVWYGNLVGYRAREPTTKYMQYIDITEEDLETFTAFFKWHGARGTPKMPDVIVRHRYD